jgi:membrane protein required for colicin V production
MTALDIGVIVVIALFLFRGVWIGFVRQIAFILALFFGYVAAGTYYPEFSQQLTAIQTPQLRFVVTYGLLFFTTYVVIMVLGLGLKKVVQISFLGWFDRLLGGVFGLGKAVFIATMVFMALTGIFSNNTPFIEKAFFTPYLMISSQMVTSIIRDGDLQAQMLPKKPAISDLLTNSVPIKKITGRATR